MLSIKGISKSDCEVIIHLYQRYGISRTLEMLDGVFSFVLYDTKLNEIYVARDFFGIRPLYYSDDILNTESNVNYVFASELKQISDIFLSSSVKQFPPGHYMHLDVIEGHDILFNCLEKYISLETPINYALKNQDINYVYKIVYDSLFESVRKRVDNTERPYTCLLSGGLDSSIIAALVSKCSNTPLHTWSIGLKGSEDLKYAKIVSKHIGSIHHSIELEELEFLKAIDEVIYDIGSYDTTTVRASVGNWLISKYIKNNSDAKVVFNGDGSDELTGGYIYFHCAPNSFDFDEECKRLLSDIHYFDVLRSDRSISSHGLEARTPFLDKSFVSTYLSIPYEIRNHCEKNKGEKYLLRKSIDWGDSSLLPKSVLWRTKEAFSDGVSTYENSWHKIIQTYVKNCVYNKELINKTPQELLESKKRYFHHLPPKTLEQLYYRETFENHFINKNSTKIIPYMWMPKFIKAEDASARSLSIYNSVSNDNMSDNKSSTNNKTLILPL